MSYIQLRLSNLLTTIAQLLIILIVYGRKTRRFFMTPEELINLQRETIVQHMKGENDHNWTMVYDTFIQDSTSWYDVVPLSNKFEGFSGVQEFYQVFESAVPDFFITVTAEYDTPGCSIREVTITGTHQGEYCGVQPTGKPISFELAAFYIFGTGDTAGKLIAERIYFDNETVLRQMRGEADAPKGVGLADRMLVGAR
jgi:predicted ester cyclase